MNEDIDMYVVFFQRGCERLERLDVAQVGDVPIEVAARIGNQVRRFL